ncbi:MAG: DUF1269 domain-containing protein [Acidimicrobiales bacterium]
MSKDSGAVPVQIIVAAFPDEGAAKAVLGELKEARNQGLIKIQNAAVLRKDEKGKLHIKETADMGGGKGATIGGVIGAGIGLIAGPLLVVPAAVGALIGGLSAKWRDSGFSNDRLERLGEDMTPDSSVIIAVVEHSWVAQVEKALRETGADMLTEALGADIASQLEAGHDVAYNAISSQEGFAAGRVAGGDDGIEGETIVVDADGITASQFVATDDGFAVRAIDANEDGIVAVEAVGLSDNDSAVDTDSGDETDS